MKFRHWVTLLMMSGCVGMSLVISWTLIQSWQGGPDGLVTISTNVYGERLIETILCPIFTIGGWISMIWLIVRSK